MDGRRPMREGRGRARLVRARICSENITSGSLRDPIECIHLCNEARFLLVRDESGPQALLHL